MVFLRSFIFRTESVWYGRFTTTNFAFGVVERQASGTGAMNDQHHQAPADWVWLAERRGHLWITEAVKIVIGIDHGVIVLRLIEHRILAAGGDHHIVYAVAIQVADHGSQLGYQRELLAELLLYKFVINLRRECMTLCECGSQDCNGERQEKTCFSHGSTLVRQCDQRQVTKVTKCGWLRS